MSGQVAFELLLLLPLTIPAFSAWSAEVKPTKNEQEQAQKDLVEPPWSDYVRSRDGFEWKLESKTAEDNVTVFKIKMTSQVWQGAPQTHGVNVFVPQKPAAPDAAFICVGGYGQPPLKMAKESGMTFVAVFGIFQGCFGVGPYEAIGAYASEQYLKTGDPIWIPHAAAVKSLVRAMDAVQAMSTKELGTPIKRFMLGGWSKMGMVSWFTAVADSRVIGIVPIGADMVNLSVQPHSLIAAQKGLNTAGASTLDSKSEVGKRFLMLTDPYSYRNKLTAAKLIVSGTNDPLYELDTVNRYWDGIPGLKYHLYLDNANHQDEPVSPKTIRATEAFFKALATGKELPKIESKVVDANGKITLSITTSVPARSARLCFAADSRNWAEAKWSNQPMTALEGGKKFTGEISKPTTGQPAVYAELDFELDGLSYSLTSQMHLVKPR